MYKQILLQYSSIVALLFLRPARTFKINYKLILLLPFHLLSVLYFQVQYNFLLGPLPISSGFHRNNCVILVLFS